MRQRRHDSCNGGSRCNAWMKEHCEASAQQHAARSGACRTEEEGGGLNAFVTSTKVMTSYMSRLRAWGAVGVGVGAEQCQLVVAVVQPHARCLLHILDGNTVVLVRPLADRKPISKGGE